MVNINLLNWLLVTPAFISVALMAAPAGASQTESSSASELQTLEATTTLAAPLVAPTLTSDRELSAQTAQPILEAPETPAAEPAEPSLVQAAQPIPPLSSEVSSKVSSDAEQLSEQLSVARPAQAATQPAQGDAAILNEITQYTGEAAATTESDPMGQVTSITQFSDVQPTDWAYQALQSLVERYGCIVGYPDGTFKGQRALTRFEFAAGMNACLDRISELLAASTADLATKEDLATLQRLQEEFAAELAALRGRVDTLEARTSELEANQFSTTTKLGGEAIFAPAQAFGGGREDSEYENQVLASGRIRLIFDTSFYGDDRLRARLQAGNFGRFLQEDSDGNTVLGNDGRIGFDTDTDNNFNIDILSYLFNVGDNFTFLVAGQVPDFYDSDFAPVVSPFASAGRGAISRFGRFNPIYRLPGSGGPALGAAVDFDFAQLHLEYIASEGGDPSPGSGLFNGDYGALAQLTLNPFEPLTVAFTYVNSYTGSSGLNTGTGSIRSQVDIDSPVVANSYGVSLNFRVAKFLQIGGWGTYSAVRALETGDAQVWTYAGTIGFPDLGKKGNLLGFVVGVEPYLGGTTGFTVDGRRSDPDNGLHIEAFYRYQLNDNISITPGVIWLTAPNQNADNEDIVVGAIRTTFSF